MSIKLTEAGVEAAIRTGVGTNASIGGTLRLHRVRDGFHVSILQNDIVVAEFPDLFTVFDGQNLTITGLDVRLPVTGRFSDA